MPFLKGSSKCVYSYTYMCVFIFAISYLNIRVCIITKLGFLKKAVLPGGCVHGQLTQNRPEIKNVGKESWRP
jgi:hypothetical protein